MIYLIIGLIVLFGMSYFVVLFIWPEWVGVSGEDSRDTLAAHQAESGASTTASPEITGTDKETPQNGS